MTDRHAELAAVADEMFEDLCPPETVAEAAGGFAPAVWKQLAEGGFTLAGLPEDAGGGGGDFGDAIVLIRAAARHAAPVPLAETALLGGWLHAQTGAVPGPGPLVSVPGLAGHREGTQVRVAGTALRIPFARFADRLAVLLDLEGEPAVVSLDAGEVSVREGADLAGQARDEVQADVLVDPGRVHPVTPEVPRELRLRYALARAVQIAGAAERALTLTMRYTAEREQFGRALSGFQAVQQSIGLLAGEVSAAGGAVDAAVGLVTRTGFTDAGAVLAVAAAKTRAGEAVRPVTRIAHQLHGAIGFTEEHQLRLTSTRLWSWRDEAGSDAFWRRELGRAVLEDERSLWHLMTESM